MATTAILSALEQEQLGLLARLEQPRTVRRAGRDFHCGRLHGKLVVLALSRIGKVAAASTATTLIEAFACDRIVFTGVAGALDDAVQVGDLVVGSHFVQHDMDASPLFPRFEVPLYRQALFACDPMLTHLLVQASHAALASVQSAAGIAAPTRPPTVHTGLIASGDRFIATIASARAVQEALRSHALEPLAIEMEGAAVAQVCHDYGLPFAAVRTISDRADDAAGVDFQQFLATVAGNYALHIVEHFVRALPAAPDWTGRPRGPC